MRAVILCGGFGTRLSEETVLKPKPMVEIGGIPILIHIMNIYSQFGINHFTLALGYKSEYIKDFFLNYYSRNSDFSIDLSSGSIEYLNVKQSNWQVDLIDTGLKTMTGGRVLKLKSLLDKDENFLLTYGDGVSNINISKLIEFHKSHGKLATVSAVRPPARFGNINIDKNNIVTEFEEKPQTGEGWINGGFFVFNHKILNYISSDSTVLEKEPLEGLARDGQLVALRHEGFWQCMDSLRDKNYLEELWASGHAPWAVNVLSHLFEGQNV